jgi:hypothetical protein
MARPNLETRRSNPGTDRLQWPSASFPHGIQMIFKKYDYKEVVSGTRVGNLSGAGAAAGGTASNTQWKTAVNRRAQESESFILELPIPKTLTDSTGVTISSFERSFIEEFLVTNAIAATTDFVGTAKKLGNAIASTAGSLFGGGDNTLGGVFSEADGKVFKRLIGTLGTEILGGLGIGEKSIGAALGSITNPLTTLHFGGVDLRSFTFSWQVYPSNPQEANDIRDIVKKVKSKILPRVQALVPSNADNNTRSVIGSSLAKAYLEYPSVVYINLLGVNEDHFPRFKPCMCSGIDVNYAEGGSILTIAEGGVPMGMNISMTFMELEIQTAEDYDSGRGTAIEFKLDEVSETTNDGASSTSGDGGTT